MTDALLEKNALPRQGAPKVGQMAISQDSNHSRGSHEPAERPTLASLESEEGAPEASAGDGQTTRSYAALYRDCYAKARSRGFSLNMASLWAENRVQEQRAADLGYASPPGSGNFADFI